MNETLTSQATWVEIANIDLPEHARPHGKDALDSLAGDMKLNGQLQNVVLSKEGVRYEVVAGVGRILAAKRLGWDKIRADVREGLTKGQKLAMTISENNEREGASPFYTAQLYGMLMQEEKLDQNGLAEKLGKDKSLIGKYLSITEVAPEVQEKWNRFHFGLRHCLEIAKLPTPEDQIKLAEECSEKDYSVRELQSRVKKLLGKSPQHPPLTKGEGRDLQSDPSVMGFHFAWKGEDLTVKGRWSPAGRGFATQSQEFQNALAEFLDKHPEPKKKAVAAPAETQAVAAPDPVVEGAGTATTGTHAVAA